MERDSNGRAAALALLILALLTLADSVTSSIFTVLADPSMSKPGFWNLGTCAIILSCISDIIGQALLKESLHKDTSSRHRALYLNASSILLASILSFISLSSTNDWQYIVAIGVPILRSFGAGSHGSQFLTLVILHDEAKETTRSSYYYATGAVVVLAQACSSPLLPILTRQSHIFLGIVSTSYCIFAFCLISCYRKATSFTITTNNKNPPDPGILCLPEANRGHYTPYNTFSKNSSQGLASESTKRGRRTEIIFFLMAISKATRPLFITYIQHKNSISDSQAHDLWFVRNTLSIIIFGIVLPLMSFSLSTTYSSISGLALDVGKISIILMSLGAFLIGFFDCFLGVTIALIVNTLGVATDLGILAFYASQSARFSSGEPLMRIAILESTGTMLGIGILYPLYQWSLDVDSTLKRGVPYYLCSLIYAFVAMLIWSLE